MRDRPSAATTGGDDDGDELLMRWLMLDELVGIQNDRMHDNQRTNLNATRDSDHQFCHGDRE